MVKSFIELVGELRSKCGNVEAFTNVLKKAETTIGGIPSSQELAGLWQVMLLNLFGHIQRTCVQPKNVSFTDVPEFYSSNVRIDTHGHFVRYPQGVYFLVYVFANAFLVPARVTDTHVDCESASEALYAELCAFVDKFSEGATLSNQGVFLFQLKDVDLSIELDYMLTMLDRIYEYGCSQCGVRGYAKSLLWESGVLTLDTDLVSNTNCRTSRSMDATCTTINFPSGKLMAADYFRTQEVLNKASSVAVSAYEKGVPVEVIHNVMLGDSSLASQIPVDLTYSQSFLDINQVSGKVENINLYAALGVGTSFVGNSGIAIWQRGDVIVFTHSYTQQELEDDYDENNEEEFDSDAAHRLAENGFHYIGKISCSYWWSSVMDQRTLEQLAAKASALDALKSQGLNALKGLPPLSKWSITPSEADADTAAKIAVSEASDCVSLTVEAGIYHVISPLDVYGNAVSTAPYPEEIANVMKCSGDFAMIVFPAKSL